VDIKDLRERTRLPVKQHASLITRLLREGALAEKL